MAIVCRDFLHSPLLLPPLSFSSPPPPLSSRSLPSSRPPIPQLITFSSSSSSSPASSHMDHHNEGRSKFMEFPYVSAPHRNLMIDLVSTVENRLDSQLLPCTLPPDVQCYQTQNGQSQATLQIRSGHNSSPIDFILGSWLHCELPTGGAINITSFSAYLNSSSDAPNFLIELIQSTPTSLVLILDLPPRKDPVLYTDYLHTFYENTKLDSYRQMLENLPEVRPYISSSLFIRCIISPTAIMFRLDTEAGGPGRLEEIIKDHIGPVAKEVLGIWLNQCACGERNVGETEKAYLEKRDERIKSRTIEIDLGSSLPRLFGPEVANRVLEAVREVFTKSVP